MQNKITIYQEGKTFFSNENEAFNLASKSFFGENKNGKIVYSIYEALYLSEKNKAKIEGKINNKLKHSKEYLVFKDLRDKSMIVKEGLKFGTDFRVYDKSQKPGINHAKYLLYIIEGKQKLNTRDLTAKARVSHSTAKTLLLAILDSEGDINYYELSWKNIL
jgi:tRNA-intron endonuclease